MIKDVYNKGILYKMMNIDCHLLFIFEQFTKLRKCNFSVSIPEKTGNWLLYIIFFAESMDSNIKVSLVNFCCLSSLSIRASVLTESMLPRLLSSPTVMYPLPSLSMAWNGENIKSINGVEIDNVVYLLRLAAKSVSK